MPDVRTQEIAAEQQVVDRVYQRLEGMRAQANALAGEGHRRAATSSLTGLVERDAMVHRAATQLRALDAEAEGIVFGRLDFDDGETYRIGRLGVRDGLEPLLVDWRAPSAEPFYRATAGERLGVVRRRVIICRGPKVLDLDDDVLSPEDAENLRVLGEGALLAALRRSRGPHMRDIVTTIQQEQDAAIRAPARGVTVITGGPGTGKTQVALHRAAYLLYTDRARFTGGRILVVGPSTVFTNYISRVLPSLGEDSVHLRAIGELAEGVTATRRDRAAVARIKGDDRMRDVLIELMWQTPPAAPRRLRLVYAGQVLTLAADDLARARRRVRARCEDTVTRPNAARPTAAAVLVDALWAKADGTHLDRRLFAEEAADRGEFQRFLRAWWPVLAPTTVLSWLTDASRVIGLDAEAAETLAASYRGRADRSPAGRSTADPSAADESTADRSPAGRSTADPSAADESTADWSVDDVPLLDELAELLGEPPAAPKVPEPEWRLRELTSGTRHVATFVLSCGLRHGWELYAPGHPTPIALAGPAIDNDAVAAAQRWAEAVILREGHRVVGWTDGFDPHGEEGYVPVLAEPLPVEEADDESPAEDPYLHVILDEAQDLSPMECRMIARRAEYASMTVVGDLGQATHPLAAGSWPQLLTRLGKRESRTLELPTGYRVPQAVADYAARVRAPGVTPTRSYRPGGTVSVRRVEDLPGAVRRAIRQAPRDATVAVIAADDAAHALAPVIAAEDAAHALAPVIAAEDAAHALAPLVDVPDAAVVPASMVKGLEYDHVIVVEPAEIVAAEPRGLNRLYVALTRSVADLVVIHRKPLPAALRDESVV